MDNFRMVLFLLLLLFALSGSSQNRILLTNVKSGKEIILNKGTNVRYITSYAHKMKKGIINDILDSTFEVDYVPLASDKIIALGEYKSHKNTWGLVLAGFSGILLGATVFGDHPSSTKLIGGIGAGISFIFAEVLLISNNPKFMKKGWRLSFVR